STANYEMVSPKGDKVHVRDFGWLLNLDGDVSASRKDGEVRGSLGTFDDDDSAANDLLGRTGSNPMNVDSFIEEWRVKSNERLFGTKPSSSAKAAVTDGEAKPADNSYTIQGGDTLWKIAQKLLGNGNRWREIYELNKDVIKNPNVIHAGVTLKLPK
ncbi:MAG: LysM peptidoglycan-binding domain-containing protein, partial [Bacteroidota bacterium]